MTNSMSQFFAQLALLLPAFLIALSFHECAHALAATLLGDDTPRNQGRLTLNPLAHIDFLGLLFLIIFRFGWAKPVIFDNRNFKHPRLYEILTALAGPLSNFLLALVSFYAIAYLPTNYLSPVLALSIKQILEAVAYVNVMLGVFNALPIPPLDGGHIIIALLVKPFPGAVLWLYRYSLFILLGLFLFPTTQIILQTMINQAINIIKMLVF
ncbi:MAG: site-2 protease family protein [bacterium]